MTMPLNYRPCDLSYYTTWWLPLRSSISNQTTNSSEHNDSKSDDDDDECVNIKQNVNRDELQTFCCIPFKIRRRK